MVKFFEDWFVIQVQTGMEKAIYEKIMHLGMTYLSPFLPMKLLEIRHRGVLKAINSPIYPGYIFITGTWNLEEVKAIAKIRGVCRFIGGISFPEKVKNFEKEVILSISTAMLASYSKVIKVGSKIKVISGPLKQLEGLIESVDRRKKKVFVNLPLLGSVIRVSLSIDFVDSVGV